MSIFKIKPNCFFNKSSIFNAIAMPVILLLFISNLSAQKESNVKLKIETGVLLLTTPHELLLPDVYGLPGLYGIFLDVEGKIKTSKNTSIGLRMGVSINEQSHVNSLVPTFDYYFIKKNVRPYLGIGVGYYFMNNFRGLFDPSGVFEANFTNKVGLLFRGGLEFNKFKFGTLDLSKFSVGLEYNYIPAANIETSNLQFIPSVVNSYIGMSIGYTIGIGKNSK